MPYLGKLKRFSDTRPSNKPVPRAELEGGRLTGAPVAALQDSTKGISVSPAPTPPAEERKDRRDRRRGIGACDEREESEVR
eukprot:CAMPEP_0194280580 /NCGR_PEP_ID=MMETSP0169-20130528/17970_1 /TAXON_ID=218684 /ORGANISM="Corethron pennatum, Strain L29A3" /LENGTH=80 /DNA_ID=CAMNT_0039025353 /DNA_START=911 /DNA_END=1153 /DNA_ORIENTATION=-